MNFGVPYLQAIHNATGTSSELEARIVEEKHRMSMELMSSINLEATATRNGERQRFIVVPREEAYKYLVMTFPDEELYPGDLLEFRGRKWIVVDVPSVSVLQTTGIVWECNYLFRFQNFDSTVIERWGVLDSGNYSTDIDIGVQISVANSQYKMYMQLDDETKKIFIDKRLAIDRLYDHTGKEILDVYKVTDVDGVSHSYGGGHLLVLRAKSDTYNPQQDNIEEMICDYIAPDQAPDIPSETTLLPCSITGRDTIRAGSGSRTYKAVFYQQDGETVADGVAPVWNVVVPVDCETSVSWTIDGTSLKLTAEMGAVGQTIRLEVSDEDGAYQTGSFDVEVTDLI